MLIWTLLLLGASTGYGQALGTWKMIPEKSSYNIGPFPKALTAKFEAHRSGEVLTLYHVRADGTSQTISETLYFDGKDHATGEPAGSERETVAFRKLNAGTAEIVHKKGGNVTTRFLRAISPDGKQMTLEIVRIRDRSPNLERRLVLEREPEKR